MVRFSLLSLVSLVPSLAAAAHVEITSPEAGAFVDPTGWSLAHGEATGVGTGQEVRVNDVVVNFVPLLDSDGDGVLDSGSWTIPLEDVAPGLVQHRSAQHSLRAEVVDTVQQRGDVVLSADQVAFYDISEFGARPVGVDQIHTRGVEARLTDAGLADVAQVVTLEAEAIHETVLLPIIDEVNASGDQIDVTLPVQLCASMDALSINVSTLPVGATDFGLSMSDFASVSGADIELCVTGAHGDVIFDATDMLARIPDHNGDGVADDFLVLDAVPEAVDSTVTIGAISGGFALDLRMSLSIAGAVAGLPIAPSVEVVTFELPCDAALHVPSASASAEFDFGASRKAQVKVEQMNDLDFVLGNLDVELQGLCAPMEPLGDVLVDVTRPLVETAVEKSLNEGDDGDPVLPPLIEKALEDFKVEETIDLQDGAVLAVHGTIDSVEEDDTGVTVAFSTNVSVETAGRLADLVPPQTAAYAPQANGNAFPVGDHYDAAVFFEAAQLSQVLHAAWSSGALHSELATIGDLGMLGVSSTLPADKAIDISTLSGLLPGLTGVVPAGSALAVRIGPATAPVVVVEDRASGYVLTLSAFQVELQVVDAVTETMWVTAVADLKTDLWVEQDDQGGLTVGFVSPQIELGLVGDAWALSAWDLTKGVSMKGILEALVLSQLEEALISLPAPRLAVPSLVSAETTLVVDLDDTLTLSTGEQIRTFTSVE